MVRDKQSKGLVKTVTRTERKVRTNRKFDHIEFEPNDKIHSFIQKYILKKIALLGNRKFEPSDLKQTRVNGIS